jgi:hypothetical protein
VLPPGVVSVRFFSPRVMTPDSVTFLLGAYERMPGSGGARGTHGVVYEIIAKREASGWQLVSARVKYAS